MGGIESSLRVDSPRVSTRTDDVPLRFLTVRVFILVVGASRAGTVHLWLMLDGFRRSCLRALSWVIVVNPPQLCFQSRLLTICCLLFGARTRAY